MRIYVGNLSHDTTEANLEAAFAAHGAVQSVLIIRDRETGTSRGFGFVEMENDTEASAAISKLNETELDGRTLTVNVARPRPPRPDRSSGGDRGESRGHDRRW